MEKKPNPHSPYNGLNITGLPTFDSNGKFVSLLITFIDYTNLAAGIPSIIPALTLQEGWVAIPMPASPPSPKKTEPKITIKKEGKNKLKKEVPKKEKEQEGVGFTVKGKVNICQKDANLFCGINLTFGPGAVGGGGFWKYFHYSYSTPKKT